MNRTQLLLTQLAEECNEVAQRCSKAIRFGLEEKQPEQIMSNAERITMEMADLCTVFRMLANEGMLPPWWEHEVYMNLKEKKIEKYLNYSRECGVLQEGNVR